MKAGIWMMVAVLIGAMAGEVVAAENNSSPAPLTVQDATPKQEMKTITFCRDKESLSPDSAVNDFSPISAEFLRQIGKPYTGTVGEARQYKVTLLEPPKHGQAQLIDESSQHWTYLPTVNYEGTDRVIFLVVSQSKQYKVVINFLVAHIFDERRKVQECNAIDFQNQ